MIEDELGPQSVADDIRSQTSRPMPREINIGTWIIIGLIIAVLVWLIWR